MLKRDEPDSSRFDGYGSCLLFLASCFLANILRTTGSFLFFTTRGCFDTRPVHHVVLERESVNHNLSENKPPMERCSEVIRIPFLKRPLQHPGHARPRKKMTHQRLGDTGGWTLTTERKTRPISEDVETGKGDKKIRCRGFVTSF